MPAAPPPPPPVSREPGFVLPAAPRDVLSGRAVNGMRCGVRGAVDAVHVEIFVDRKVLLLPAGIGLRPPLRRAGLSRLAGGACAYPLHTLDPTGTVFVGRSHPRLLGDLFAVWGQRLAPRRLLSFSGRVRAFRNGREWRGDARRIPLQRHDEIVLEVGGYVPPHSRYLFPEGQ
ncbi:MAG: hypothetical protein QOH00_781 [Gaiellales bacterium]|nr:hypothetical protein [Gaiellales bacterium]